MMNCQEKEGDPEYPMRFLTKCQGSGVFDGLTKTAGVWVNSEVVVGKWWEGVGDGSSEIVVQVMCFFPLGPRVGYKML